MAVDIALYAIARPGSIQMVIAPTDDQTRIIMQQVSGRLYQIDRIRKYLVEKHSPYWSIEFRDEAWAADAAGLVGMPQSRRRARKTALRQATQILARTAGPDGKGLRGRNAHRVIVDEAAFVPDGVMEEVITPLLADFNGQLVLISTPAGRNHFWRAFERGRDPLQERYRSFQFPTSENPHIPAEYIESERETKPERVFLVEYEAVFADAEGQVFRNVAESCSGEFRPPEPGCEYVAGLDLARINDFTVLCVMTADRCELVHMDRYNKVDWPLIRERIEATLRRYGAECLMEINHVGDVMYSDLANVSGLKVRPFVTSSKSKGPLIDSLAVAFEKGQIRLPRRELCPVLVDELQSYAYHRTESGHLASSAPEGQHDDCVISLALAWRQTGLGAGVKRMRAA